MKIDIQKTSDTSLYVKAEGKLDIDNAAEYGMTVKDALDDIKELVLDFSEITYVASIGLRVILELYKQMSAQGSMKVINVQKQVLDVFTMTGFNNFLNIV